MAERRTERRLIGEYEAMVRELTASLTPDNHALALEIAKLPMQIRGYGHVKEKSLAHDQDPRSRADRRLPQPCPRRGGGVEFARITLTLPALRAGPSLSRFAGEGQASARREPLSHEMGEGGTRRRQALGG